MITQYSGGTSTIPSDFVTYVSSRVNLVEKYVIMQTGENEWSALVFNPVTKKGEKYVCSRNSSGYSQYYSVSKTQENTFSYSVSNDYYTYSNDGVGKVLDLPVYDGVSAFALTAGISFFTLWLLFERVLFKWRKR